MLVVPMKWDASPNFNSRSGCKIDQIVIHDCEGSGTGSEAYFDMRESRVSAHFIVFEQGELVVQQVAIANRAWHACNFNSRSIGIEMAGYSAKGFPASQIITTQCLTRYLCREYNIPIRYAKGGVGPGITSHWSLGVAGGRHFDPAPNDAWIENFINGVAKLDPTLLPPPNTWVPPGNTSVHVGPLDLSTYEGVQRALNALGASPKLDEDNVPGSLTEAAIKEFQKSHGLTVNGDADAPTKAEILKQLSGG